jgi:hypothetical protein
MTTDETPGTRTRKARPMRQRDIEAAQRRYPVGTRVRYWSGAKIGEPTGTGTVEAAPYMFGGHTLCAFISDPNRHSDHIAVTHLEALR